MPQGFVTAGELPVASVPSGAGSLTQIPAASITFGGFSPSSTMVISGPRVSWVGAEVLHIGASAARLSWIGAEVLHIGSAQARVSWVGNEVLHIGAAAARVTWMGVEVLRSINLGSKGGSFVQILWGQ